MNINSVNSSMITPAAMQSTTTSQAGGATGRNEFLQLLATQLQFQDPLNPLQNSDFVAQLAQFSSLEQLIMIRESLGGNQQTGSTEPTTPASNQA
jgi:flagellar basal-body rod modification protein FlgD